MKHKSYDLGYANGYEEGYREGYDDGYMDGYDAGATNVVMCTTTFFLILSGFIYLWFKL